LLRSDLFFFKGVQYGLLNLVATRRIDRMSDIRKHPAATGLRVCFRRRRKRRAAVGTVPCSHFILGRTATAFFCEFATWHRNEISALSLDDLQVSDNECLINRDGAKRAQSVVYVRNKLDSNLCDYH